MVYISRCLRLMPIVPALITLPGACSCVGWLRPSLVATALTTWKSTRSCLFFISVQMLSEHFDSMWPSVSGLALHARQVGSESSPMIRAQNAEVCITPSCAAIRKLSVVGLRCPSPSHMWVASLSVSSFSTYHTWLSLPPVFTICSYCGLKLHFGRFHGEKLLL